MLDGSTITYLDGWYQEEHDGARPFRWMSRSARCRILDVPAGSWLRVTASHSSAASPVLTVSRDGRLLGRHTLRGDVSQCVVPLGGAGAAVDVLLELDRTFRAEADPRELGINVRLLEVFVPDEADEHGWYGWEREEYFPFRWMGMQATTEVPRAQGRFLSLAVGTDMADGEQRLSIDGDKGALLSDFPLLHGWHLYDVPLGGCSDAGTDDGRLFSLTFRVNRLASPEVHPADPRPLGIRVGALEIHDDARRHQYADRFYEAAHASLMSVPARPDTVRAVERSAPDEGFLPEDTEGWYWWEFQDVIPFRWMKREARLTIPAALLKDGRSCTIPVFSEYADRSQLLTVATGGAALATFALSHCWDYYTVALPPSTGDLVLTLRLNELMAPERHPGDARDLGARVGPLRIADADPASESLMAFQRENAAANQREMAAGATVLSSYPLNLGIDLYAKCNINPPCVYCLWDRMKETEGPATALTVDDRTLEGYGEFFDGAQSLTNCSFGEPLLHPRLADILDLVARRRKSLELSTNGQAFTPASVAALAGKPMVLYVSLDSASGATYARLRNDRWHDVVTGLLYLRDARRRANGLPKLNLVFMPMRANRHDLDRYFRLCRMVEATQLVLRPLLRLEHSGIVVDRGGYHYDYDREQLTRAELEDVFDESARLSRRYGVAVASQFDFGKYQT